MCGPDVCTVYPTSGPCPPHPTFSHTHLPQAMTGSRGTGPPGLGCLPPCRCLDFPSTSRQGLGGESLHARPSWLPMEINKLPCPTTGPTSQQETASSGLHRSPLPHETVVNINMGLVHTQAEAPAHWSSRRQVRPSLTPACEHCGQSTSALILPLFL